MRKVHIERTRKWFAITLLLVIVLALVWHFSPGLPVLIGPYASAKTRAAGQELFTHEWEPYDALAGGDGLGPVFNAKSCVACHNQGGIGGGGSNQFNVVNFEVLPNSRDREHITGTIHAAASSREFQESLNLVRKLYPVIPGGTRIENHCTVSFGPFDPVRTEQIQTTALWGAGWIDRISSKAIVSNRRSRLLNGIVREFKLDFSSIPAGRARILPDGRVGKFGWRAQFATLEEFVAAACANELGLGTPMAEQARPLARTDYPNVEPDLNRKQFRQLVAFVDTLPKPVEVIPESGPERDAVLRGKQVFSEIGCAICHVPNLGGVKGVYSDFLLHRISDGGDAGSDDGYGPRVPPPQPLPDDVPHPSEWKTPPLWGVADSAPYMHDGGAPTLEAAIQRHGGAAKPVRDAYRTLSPEDRAALIQFLNSLKAPPDAIAVASK